KKWVSGSENASELALRMHWTSVVPERGQPTTKMGRESLLVITRFVTLHPGTAHSRGVSSPICALAHLEYSRDFRLFIVFHARTGCHRGGAASCWDRRSVPCAIASFGQARTHRPL